MKIFIDSADLSEIQKAVDLGLCDGVTTNPTLIAKEMAPLEQRIREISRLVPGPILAEAISMDVNGILKEGRALAKIARNVVVKIPMTQEGLVACKKLAEKEIKSAITLVFSPSQAILAAKAEAAYICPFLGRLEDNKEDGIKILSEILQIYRNYHFPTQVLVASVRNTRHVVESAKIGAHAVTVPFKVLEEAQKHFLTETGIQKFLVDAGGSQK